MDIRGEQADFEAVLDPDYFVRYDACNRILEANGIPLKIPDLRRVFSGILEGSGAFSEKDRQRCQRALDELIAFIRDYGKPPDYTGMTREEINECFLDACSSSSTKPDLNRIRDLCEHGADLHVHDARGFAALKLATTIYDRDVMKYFLDRGADINEVIPYKGGNTSTVWIEKAGYAALEDLRLMLEAGARVDDRDSAGNTALMKYCAGNPIREGVALFLEHGANPALVNSEQYSTLHLIARQNADGATVKLLIDHGAVVDGKNDLGETPLHVNSTFTLAGDERIALCLLEHGADPNLRNADGDTPLILATRCEKEAVVKALMEHGARKELKDAAGKTAYAIALAKGFPKIARLIDPQAFAEQEKKADRSELKKIREQIVEMLKAGKRQYRSDKEGYSWFSRQGDIYQLERFENGASPPDVSSYSTDEAALEFLYETNRNCSKDETEISVYRQILNSLVKPSDA